MSGDCKVEENEAACAELLPIDMRNRLQKLKELYSQAESTIQTLEERLQKCAQCYAPWLPSREI